MSSPRWLLAIWPGMVLAVAAPATGHAAPPVRLALTGKVEPHASPPAHKRPRHHRRTRKRRPLVRAPAPPAAAVRLERLTQPELPPEADVWLVTLNVKLFGTPRYLGGTEYGVIGYPTINRRRFGDPVLWSSPDDSVQYSFYESPRVSAGVVAAYRGGRYREDEGKMLAGIHKTPWTAEPGVFADLWLVPDVLRTRAEIRRGFRDRDGFVATLGADMVGRWGRWTGAVGPRLKFGDDHFADNQFGITAADAVNNPAFQPFRAQGGLTSVGLYGSLTWKQDETWSYTLQGGWDRLVGDAARSPIVRTAGNRDQFTVGAVVSYTFQWWR